MNDTITISRKEFKGAAIEALKNMLKDDDMKGEAAFVLPMISMMFTHDLESQLFGEKGEEA